MVYKCKHCEFGATTVVGIRRHYNRAHNYNSEQFYIEYILDGIRPTCKCGCGEHTTFQGTTKGYSDYVRGHISRVKNNWGHNQAAKTKSVETRREQYATGNRKQWNDGLSWNAAYSKETQEKMMASLKTPERGYKISTKLKGIKKSEEHKKKITNHWQEYWSKDENRDAQRVRHVKWMQISQCGKESKLETLFKSLLDALKIEYDFQYNCGGFLYDFRLLNTNILIEVDGDFHHCNPNTYSEPSYEIQKHTIEHDKIKNETACSNNFILLRFWENDIKKHPAKVIKILLKNLENLD